MLRHHMQSCILHRHHDPLIFSENTNSCRKTFNVIPSHRRKDRRKNQATVLLRPREKSRVYHRGLCIRKKRKKLPIKYTSGLQDWDFNRSLVRSSRLFARTTTDYIIAIKWRVVVQSELCFRSDGQQKY